MKSRILRRVAYGALIGLAPLPAVAQGFSVSPYAARSGAMAGSPTLVGLTATAWTGPAGFRIGGALGLPATPLAPLAPTPGPEGEWWTADLDLVLSGGRAGLSLGGIEPGLLLGFGAEGRTLPDGVRATVPVWSYGAWGEMRPVRWLGLEAEARYRMPHESDPDALPEGLGAGWEYRAGLAIHVGRRAGRARTVPARGPRRAIPARGSRRTIRLSPRPRTPADLDDARSLTLATADRYVGVPYVWGGDTPREGFDCSGFVQYVYALNGFSLPRVSRDQARAGEALPPLLSVAEPGDLLFFAGGDGVVDHVAIYVGDRRIIHAAGSRGAVAYDHLDSGRASWYRTHLVSIRRVIH